MHLLKAWCKEIGEQLIQGCSALECAHYFRRWKIIHTNRQLPATEGFPNGDWLKKTPHDWSIVWEPIGYPIHRLILSHKRYVKIYYILSGTIFGHLALYFCNLSYSKLMLLGMALSCLRKVRISLLFNHVFVIKLTSFEKVKCKQCKCKQNTVFKPKMSTL